MGRTTPSFGAPPSSQRRDARAKRAKQTVNKDIPSLLQSYHRARKGVEAAELIADPPPVAAQTASKHPDAEEHDTISRDRDDENAAQDRHGQKDDQLLPTIRLQCADTLRAAAELYQDSKSRKSKASRIAILNMASPLRPGGGFLTGATSQEESLCMRTTLYPSLREEFYRLPEVGGVYTPDVLVFRTHDVEATDLPKNERLFIDVITAGMLRFPEVEEDEDGEKGYASAKDRDLVERKMKAVLRMARMKGVRKVVLGAWGCGAYGNPLGEVAKAWKRILLNDGPEQGIRKNKQKISRPETWAGMEIVFAIKDRRMAEAFSKTFALELEGDTGNDGQNVDEEEDGEVGGEKAKKIAELEEQIAGVRSDVLKERLRSILNNLKEADG